MLCRSHTLLTRLSPAFGAVVLCAPLYRQATNDELVRFLAVCRPDPSANEANHVIIASLLNQKCTASASKYGDNTNKIMGKAHKLNVGKRIRLTSDTDDEVHVHCEDIGGRIFLLIAITSVSFGVHHSVSEAFEDWKALVHKAIPASDAAASKGALSNRVNATLQKFMSKYNTSSLQEATRKVDQVKGVMRENVDIALANAPKFDEVDQRSAEIEASSRVFHNKAKDLRCAMCKQYWKVTALIALIIIIIIVIIVVVVVKS